MGEHLDPDQLAARAPDVVLDDLAVYLRHLFERQFACQHHRVGPLREELHGFGIRNVALGRNMHFDPDAPGVEYRREIGGDDGVDAFGLGAVDYLVDGLHLVLVDDGVDREVGLDPCGVCRGDDLRQVVEREIRSRRRAHVELPDAEIYRVRPGLYGCGQCFVRPYGGHDFYLGALHSVVCGGCPCVVCRRGVGGISFCVPSGSGRIRASVPCGIFRPKGCRGCPAPFRSAAKSAVR